MHKYTQEIVLFFGHLGVEVIIRIDVVWKRAENTGSIGIVT